MQFQLDMSMSVTVVIECPSCKEVVTVYPDMKDEQNCFFCHGLLPKVISIKFPGFVIK